MGDSSETHIMSDSRSFSSLSFRSQSSSPTKLWKSSPSPTGRGQSVLFLDEEAREDEMKEMEEMLRTQKEEAEEKRRTMEKKMAEMEEVIKLLRKEKNCGGDKQETKE